MNEICPTCHQRIAVERFDVRLPPFKARLLDLIKASGAIGMSSTELHNEMYRGYPKPRLRTAIKSHIHQINDLLVETEWRIVSDGRAHLSRWYLQRERRRVRGVG